MNSISEKWNKILSEKYESIKSVGMGIVDFFEKDRLTFDEYGCLIALIVSSRSEDPHTKAGCCILDKEKRILSTGYNGLKKGVELPPSLKKEEFRDIKRKLFIHAENNALSMIRKGEADTIYLNISPCINCGINILAHGINNVVFINNYKKNGTMLDDIEYQNIFKFYNVNYRKVSSNERNRIYVFLREVIINQLKIKFL